jgi:hypothetical protein
MKYYLLWKILPFILSLTLFGTIISLSPPPPNWRQASVWQIIVVLISLLALLIFFYNLFIPKFRYRSIIALATLTSIFLHSLRELDLVSGTIIIGASLTLILVLSDFKLLKLSKPKSVSREPLDLPPQQNRLKRLRRLSYLTTRKK